MSTIFFFLNFFFLKFFYAEKQCGRQLWNAVEREPVETRVLNPTTSEASYKPKKRSYRTTNLKKEVLAQNSPGAEMSSAELSSAETAGPKRTRPVG